jgi:hypothetical protein
MTGSSTFGPREVPLEEAAIAREQAGASHRSVGADQEVGNQVLATAATPPVGAPQVVRRRPWES